MTDHLPSILVCVPVLQHRRGACATSASPGAPIAAKARIETETRSGPFRPAGQDCLKERGLCRSRDLAAHFIAGIFVNIR